MPGPRVNGPSSKQSRAAPPHHPPHVTNNISKHSPKLSNSKTPVSNPSPKPPHQTRTPVSNASPRVSPSPRVQGNVSAPRASSVVQSQSARSQSRSVPPSPAKNQQVVNLVNNGSGSRESPVVISSGSSSPASIQSVHSNSRPNSPSASSISIIKSREVSPQPHRSRTTSPAVIGTKRHRKEDIFDGPDAKNPRLELQNGTSVPSSPNHLQERPKVQAKSRRRQPAVVNSGYDLTKQMMQAKRKVRTTQELVSSLGIESRVQTSPPVASVSDLVPNENKSELMDRFFSSQPAADDQASEVESVGPDTRPGTAADDVSSSGTSSHVQSRVNTPAVPRESVEDILSQLPPIDTAQVLADLEKELAEEEPEVDGLIPAYKPIVEVTPSLVDDLNNGQLDHIGGIRDHTGEFKEWHEMASLHSKDGEILHILPYSVID